MTSCRSVLRACVAQQRTASCVNVTRRRDMALGWLVLLVLELLAGCLAAWVVGCLVTSCTHSSYNIKANRLLCSITEVHCT